MTDLIERLRDWCPPDEPDTDEAADEIERLQARVAELKVIQRGGRWYQQEKEIERLTAEKNQARKQLLDAVHRENELLAKVDALEGALEAPLQCTSCGSWGPFEREALAATEQVSVDETGSPTEFVDPDGCEHGTPWHELCAQCFFYEDNAAVDEQKVPICECANYYGTGEHHPECPVLNEITRLRADSRRELDDIADRWNLPDNERLTAENEHHKGKAEVWEDAARSLKAKVEALEGVRKHATHMLVGGGEEAVYRLRGALQDVDDLQAATEQGESDD